MKKILAMAAVAALAAGASVYAANPFSDVSTSDWAYQAVSDLSDQGVVEGYPDGTFKGQNNVTRYEVAQIVARLLAKEDQLNAEQRATVDKLAGEYADELDTLGVRVGNLEKKVGNISWSGDARMQYVQSYKTDNIGPSGAPLHSTSYATTKSEDDYTGRVRLNMKAQVNDNTYVYGRFLSKMNFQDGDSADTSMDRLFVHSDFGKVGVTLGRSELYIGQTGMFYDDIFDGVRANYDAGNVNFEVGYGRFKTINTNLETNLRTFAEAVYDNENWDPTEIDAASVTKPEAVYASVKGNFGAFQLGADYIDIKGYSLKNAGDLSGYPVDFATVWGLNAAYTAGDVTVFGDYYKNTEDNFTKAYGYQAGIDKPVFWTAGLAYGKQDNKKPGSFRLAAQYVSAEAGSYGGGSAMDLDPMALTFTAGRMADNGNWILGEDKVTYWLASTDVTLAENLRLHGEYAFNVKGESAGLPDADYDDLVAVSLNYVF